MIDQANKARRQLRRKLEAQKSKLPRAVRHAIPDDRLPKGPSRPFALFAKARWASGDLSGNVADVSRQLGEEYKQLSPAEKKVSRGASISNDGSWHSLRRCTDEMRQAYEDIAAADSERYAREVQDVLGREVRTSPSP